MTVVIVLLIIAGIAWYVMTHRPPKAEPAPEVTPAQRAASDRLEAMKQAFLAEVDYLKARWDEREQAKQAGVECVPKWWWDPPTERQIVRLRDELGRRGISMTLDPYTKGSVSDVIGLFEQPDELDAEVLKFFKIPAKGATQTRARYEAVRLLADPETKRQWDSRPPGADQRAFFEFFGIELPRGTTYDQSMRLRLEAEQRLRAENNPRLNEWAALEQILGDLDDPDTRDTYEIGRKPSRAKLKKILDELEAEGHSIVEVAGDLELLADKLRDANA